MIELFTAEQNMRLLDKSRAGFYGLIKNEGFPAPIKIGGSSRWLVSEVNEWIEKQAAKPRPLAQAMESLKGGAK